MILTTCHKCGEGAYFYYHDLNLGLPCDRCLEEEE